VAPVLASSTGVPQREELFKACKLETEVFDKIAEARFASRLI
jgi:hypothetical protein